MKRIIFVVLVFCSSAAMAATARFDTTVQRVMSDADAFGGCMVYVETRLRDVGLDCPSRWVSFSCSGDFASRADANRNFDIAQLALVTGATIRISVDDTQRHNGYCVSRRIDLYAN